MKKIDTLKDKALLLPKRKKIQLATSAVLTAVLMISLPTFAWFANNKKTASMIKVNAPTVLTIGAGSDDASDMINLSEIDVEETVGISRVTEGNYVFAIRGKYLSTYDLQIARTTNIPFKYEIYRVSKVEKTNNNNSADEDLSLLNGLGTNNAGFANGLKDGSYNGTRYNLAEYTSSKSEKFYYPYTGDPVTGIYLNGADKSVSIAENGTAKIGSGTVNIDENETFHKHNYGSGSSTYDNVNEYAEPLYWQKKGLNVNYKKDTGDFVDYYVLKITWTEDFSNNKETDMIYITARRS